MNFKIEKSWKKILNNFLKSDNFKKIFDFIESQYSTGIIYPKEKDLFSAFSLTPFEKVKVVVIGQDPYHNPHQAHGLCFSVQNGITPPPSLKNIYKEIENDLNIKKNFENGNLESWAKQGVLLLNSVLTVKENSPGSHAKKGWEKFTDEVIKQLSKKKENLVFILWGNYAKEKGKIIDRKKHLILEASHPSPFSAYNGFFGCKHFSKTNKYLRENKKKEINW